MRLTAYRVFVLAYLCCLPIVLLTITQPTLAVHFGDRYSDLARLPAGALVIQDADGYDGQFYYALAVDPLLPTQGAHGVTFDKPAYRNQRILYPLLAWAFAFGQEAAVPMGLVAVNLFAYALLAWMGGLYAESWGRSGWWGLSFVLYPGLAMAVRFDTVELVAVALLVTGITAYAYEYRVLGTVALLAAVLTRETMLLPAFGLAFSSSFPRWHLSGITAVAGAWQGYLWQQWGQVPILSGGPNLASPFMGWAERWLWLAGHGLPGEWLVEVVALAALAALIGMALQASWADDGLKVALALECCLVACLGWMVLQDAVATLRATSTLTVLALMVVFGLPRAGTNARQAGREVSEPLAGSLQTE